MSSKRIASANEVNLNSTIIRYLLYSINFSIRENLKPDFCLSDFFQKKLFF